MTSPLADLEAILSQYHPAAEWDLSGRIAAAVCIPISESGGELEAWVIRRPAWLRHHGGEFSFPGGKTEPGDADLQATALREAMEELGIRAAALRIIGLLSPIPVATSEFAINPVVAFVDPAEQPQPAPAEVAELIRTPLAAFYDGRIVYEAVDMRAYVSPIFRFATGRLFGASAHVLLELLTLYTGVTGRTLPKPMMVDEPPWASSKSDPPASLDKSPRG
jgi:8-oxo-dGTP pyrophosphatase MutT (NUDIX family)